MKERYTKTRLQTVVNIPTIISIHYFEFDRSFVFAGESHDFWEMVYIDKGKVRVRTDSDDMVLEQGEIIERGSHEELLAMGGRYYELYTGKKELD